MNIKNKKIVALAPLLCLMLSFNTSAMSIQENMTVNSIVENGCTFFVPNVDLGIISYKQSYNTSGSLERIGNISISVQCNKNIGYYMKIPQDSGGPTKYWTKLPHVDGIDNLWLYIFCRSKTNGVGNCYPEGRQAPTLTDAAQTEWTLRTATGLKEVWDYEVRLQHSHSFTKGVYQRSFPLTITF